MVFNSLTFVVFFACVLGLHSLPLPWTTEKINLLIASYLFYAAWNPPFVVRSLARGPGTRCSPPRVRRVFTSRTTPSCRATTFLTGRI
jgi:hypothetical protein